MQASKQANERASMQASLGKTCKHACMQEGWGLAGERSGAARARVHVRSAAGAGSGGRPFPAQRAKGMHEHYRERLPAVGRRGGRCSPQPVGAGSSTVVRMACGPALPQPTFRMCCASLASRPRAKAARAWKAALHSQASLCGRREEAHVARTMGVAEGGGRW
eukprot:scaffold1761_cov357-Prasinococcus_capsulatus_cf.AAC.7